ncbi:hypothetical protein SNE40_009882 [Patella caerulea]|uniref:Seipin n=1 Tax=Patella caerulea TaxID=87958 RepID=A0AAN8PZ52_PATCE
MTNRLLGVATNVLEWTGFFLQWTVSKLKYTVLKISVISGILVFLLWLSIFVYASFYYIYMPHASHVNEAYFEFDVCENGVGMCSFPTANVTFGKYGREEILRAGQTYRILVDLELPESPINQEIGMFMVKVQMYDRTGKLTARSSRSAVLHYQSFLLKIIKTLAFAPAFIAGLSEEKQTLQVEIFSAYVDDLNYPSVGTLIEIQNKKIQIYSAKLNIFAYFTGLRYYLFYWPASSGAVGIACNFVFFCVIAALSWYKYFCEEEEEIADPILFNRRYSLFDRRARIQAQLDREKDAAEETDESSNRDINEDLSEADRINIQPETVGILVNDNSHDIQDESIGVLSPEGEETVLKSGDVTLLTATTSALRQRRPSQQLVHFDLPN